MAFQFAFAGDGIQDAGAFLASFKNHVVSIGKVNDIEKLPLLVETFYSRAQEWYESTSQSTNQLPIARSTISKQVHPTS